MGLIDKFKVGMGKTRQNFSDKIGQLVNNSGIIDDEFIEELEMTMILADIGVPSTRQLIIRIRNAVREGKISRREDVPVFLKQYIKDIVAVAPDVAHENAGLHVIIVVGVNGVGKTTSIGKLANTYKREGKKVLLAAGDTFRAAAGEQLALWAERAGAEIVRHSEGSDPAAVVFDAAAAAKARQVDVLIIDTAGRLHTKINLMEELKKIRRILSREIPGAPHETLLVLDAVTGQNAIHQAKVFNETVELTGVVLTKLDGTAKGGVVIAIRNELGLPVKWVGLGEKVEDLERFSAEAFVDAIFTDK